MEPLDPERARQEAIGAFVHELRTPLTSIRMVLEIGKRAGSDGRASLDEELIQMMETSVTDLQRLADALQEMSRLERGRLVIGGEPTSLTVVLDRMRELTGIAVDGEAPGEIAGEWDRERLAVALGGMVAAANRCGAGSGVVRYTPGQGPGVCELHLESGTPSGVERAIDADLGHGFYRGHALIRAMGGTVAVHREAGYMAIRISLPTQPAT